MLYGQFKRSGFRRSLLELTLFRGNNLALNESDLELTITGDALSKDASLWVEMPSWASVFGKAPLRGSAIAEGY